MDKKIVSNPSEKSAVWKIFGFYEIEKKVVKENVVCRICHAEYKPFGEDSFMFSVFTLSSVNFEFNFPNS